jgi:hypothetical protein
LGFLISMLVSPRLRLPDLLVATRRRNSSVGETS